MSSSHSLARLPAPSRPITACLVLLACGQFLLGCAGLQSLFRSAGTYAVARPTPTELGGRGEVHGSILLTSALGSVMMEGRDPPPVAGLQTTVAVEPLGLAVETSSDGTFVLPHLDPGAYHLAFADPDGREIWTEFNVEEDQRLEVVVWIQWGDDGQFHMSEGTTPFGMYPGASGAYAISSGSSGRASRGKSGGGG